MVIVHALLKPLPPSIGKKIRNMLSQPLKKDTIRHSTRSHSHVPRHYLNVEQKWAIVAELYKYINSANNSESIPQSHPSLSLDNDLLDFIAAKFNVCRDTICRIWYQLKNNEKTGILKAGIPDLNPLPHPGRPHCLTQEKANAIVSNSRSREYKTTLRSLSYNIESNNSLNIPATSLW